MTTNVPITFSWEGTYNPNDPSGVAVFGGDGITVRVELNNFSEASRLFYLIKSAYEKGRHDAIDRAVSTIPTLLNNQRYE
jgi:hypothetical protein